MFAQLSLIAILFSVVFLLLPSMFKGWDVPPPWRWPGWGKIVGLIGVCLCGWICISCAFKLGKRRFSNWRLSRILGPYDVLFMQGSPPQQPFKLRIQQQTRGPASIERMDVSLIYVERIVQVYCDQAPSALVRDHELWSNTKTCAVERPAESTIEISTDFAIPEQTELHRRRNSEQHKKPGAGKTEETLVVTRHFQWRVRIETYLTDGRATKALFCLPTEVTDPATPNTGIGA